MTDKQIIIDGVDVSRCGHYDANADKESYFLHDCKKEHAPCWSCSSMPNCLYKKWQRKEQECEELKENLPNAITRLMGELDQLKAENNELKAMFKDLSYENQKFSYQIEEQTKQLEPFKDEYFKGLDNVVIAELAKKSIRITAENSKLKQTLAEIKEIAENGKRFAERYMITGEQKANVLTYANAILQKISECEGNNG